MFKRIDNWLTPGPFTPISACDMVIFTVLFPLISMYVLAKALSAWYQHLTRNV